MNTKAYSFSFFASRFLAMLFCCLSAQAIAQPMEVTPGNSAPFTPENLISNVFLGDGVEVLSVTFAGDPVQVGYFNNALNAIGIKRGIVMSSGDVNTPSIASNGSVFSSANTASTATDASLAATTTSTIFDVVKYTIQFRPFADTLRFEYVFASEEYPEYACTGFNDVFGFFISGPGIVGTKNIAIVPGTTNLPVTINNVNPGNNNSSCAANTYPALYNDNNNSSNQPVFDGVLDVFVAQQVVIPCSTYTITLALADAGDGVFDTGVFLAAKSFGTSKIEVVAATATLDGTVVEGCTDGNLKFILPVAPETDIPIDYTIIGSATNGVDYETIPSDLFFAAGDSIIEIPIVAFEDNIDEGLEAIGIDIQVDPCNRDTFWIYLRDNQLFSPDLIDQALICLGNSVQLDAELNIPQPPPPTFIDTVNHQALPINTLLAYPLNVFGVLPTTLGPGMIQSVCVEVTNNWIDDVDLYLQAPDGSFTELFTDIGLNSNNASVCFTPDATTNLNSVNQQIIALYPPVGNVPSTDQNLYFTGTFTPDGDFADLYGGPANGTWNLLVRDDATGFITTITNWSLIFEPLYEVNYAWSPTAGLSCSNCPNPVASPTVTTEYFLTITDSYGCTIIDSTTISVGAAAGETSPLCQVIGEDNITIAWTDIPTFNSYFITVDGGAPIILPAGTTTYSLTGLGLDQDVVFTVQGVTSCPTIPDTITCSTPACVGATVSGGNIVDVSCFGGSNGIGTVTATGPSQPFLFTISTTPQQSNSTGQWFGLSAGTYTVSVTNQLNCTVTTTITIEEPDAIVITPNVIQEVSCFQGSNGAVDAVVSGGSGGYTFNWSNSSTFQIATGLAIGTYTVTVSDSESCSATSTVSVEQAPDIVLSLIPVDANCFNAPTGQIQAAATGGSGGFTYLWNDGQTSSTAINLVANNYTVTITDVEGCTAVATGVVDHPAALTLSLATNPASCGNANGSIVATVTGGTPNYSFIWNDGQTTGIAVNLVVDDYTVTVTDLQNCTISASANVSEPDALVSTISGTNVTCAGTNNGTITVITNGGVAPYSYDWNINTLPDNPNQAGLGAGTYTVTVTDNNSCSFVLSQLITAPTAITTSLVASTISCNGVNDANITMGTSGGTTPYQWLWSGPGGFSSLDEDNDDLYAGTYNVTVTDANGCLANSAITIAQPAVLTITANSVNALCFNESTGSTTANANGGTTPYNFAWTLPSGGNQNSQNLTGVPAGQYFVTVTDDNGCTAFTATNVGQPATSVQTSIAPDTICFGANNGSLTTVPTGGLGGYTYEWTNGSSTATAFSLSAGTYTVTVSDVNGCSVTLSQQVVSKPQIAATLSQVAALCTSTPTGLASVTGVTYGGVPANMNDFTYEWSTFPEQYTPIANNLLGGSTFTVTVTDALGCTAIASIGIGNPPPMSASIDSTYNVQCFGQNNGFALASANGGTTPYSYAWSVNANEQTTAGASNLFAGLYGVSVTDANGCVAATTTIITQPTELMAGAESTNILCKDALTGTATALASGGTTPYTYTWITGGNTETINTLPDGEYVVTVTDDHGCTKTATTTITEPDSLLQATAFTEDAICFASPTGFIQILVQGGTPPFSTSLNGIDYGGAFLIPGLDPGEYIAYITDDNGCQTAVDGLTVGQPDAISVNLGLDTIIWLGNSVQLLPEVIGNQGPLSFVWDNDSPDTSALCLGNCSSILVTPSVQTTYLVTVTDAVGCSANDDIVVILNFGAGIAVPTGFSPSGDPMNQALHVHGSEGATILAFRVFDRWGNQVFEQFNFDVNNLSIGWDGTWKGQPLDPGSYVWTLDAAFANGLIKTFKGETMLMR